MDKNQHWNLREGMLLVAAIAFVLLVHGAIPFLMIPTLDQAVWTAGFSQSFANGSWFDIYAHDFGIPKPAAIAFGLAGAWPASLLIRLGFYPADAYSTMVALWLLVAFFSAYKISRRFGVSRPTALLGGVTWMSMPIIWAQAYFSMVSLGAGLLAFYFLAAINLFWREDETNKVTLSTVVFYFLAAIISVFMDGYSFMMFATGASILFAHAVISRPEMRRTLLRAALPVHVASFALAYVLYAAYIGRLNFDAHPIDFFRGTGLDLSFIVIPTKGIHWLPDLLGLSLRRTGEEYFGTGTVWTSTFSLPIILAGLTAFWLAKKRVKLAMGVFLVAAFGFYMALGPSLKINSTIPEYLQSSYSTSRLRHFMPADLAVMPTGNAWISEKLPGFDVMRVSHRWSALGVFALWMLVMIRVARTDRKGRAIWVGILFGVIVLNLPNIPKELKKASYQHMMFHQIDDLVIPELRQQIKKDEIVVFLPRENDFVVNYLAPRAGFRTFNIGGDKNIAEAITQWPSSMLGIGAEFVLGDSPVELVPEDIPSILKLLADGTADVILIPYFSLYFGKVVAHWNERVTFTSSGPHEIAVPLNSLVKRQDTSIFVPNATSPQALTGSPDDRILGVGLLRIELTESNEGRKIIEDSVRDTRFYPIKIGVGLMDRGFLTTGWFDVEAHHVWSQAESSLRLLVPEHCRRSHLMDRPTSKCFTVFKFNVFGASQERPVEVYFSTSTLKGIRYQFIKALQALPYFDVVDTDLFASVRLR
ncbi:MAG: hypothetical protein BECKG1743D_GA0114223_102532 [Candidatus Kentron sp. G]|nr:MAG: hypothetical protein BECKG1743F_GA0114225_102021 [Candidatus Kentron sp. G]VFM98333.1 MAG: hypothetical protein BECKG1743E_GA0114224_101842 [Candidatus Kentron sp. G]VFN01113.1 MAG: hypothetical protein BECKG1743D_GA0114223_102532 [Candidatus Kentron sp. G]